MNKRELLKSTDGLLDFSYDKTEAIVNCAGGTIDTQKEAGENLACSAYELLDNMLLLAAMQMAGNTMTGNSLNERFKYSNLEMTLLLGSAEKILQGILDEITPKLKGKEEALEKILGHDQELSFDENDPESISKTLEKSFPGIPVFYELLMKSCDYAKEQMM